MMRRCERGDIAIIINETPKCRGNIGVLVRVRGPYEYLDLFDAYCWTIKPVGNQKMLVQRNGLHSDPVLEYIFWKEPRMLPDKWLLPIRRAGKTISDELIEEQSKYKELLIKS